MAMRFALDNIPPDPVNEDLMVIVHELDEEIRMLNDGIDMERPIIRGVLSVIESLIRRAGVSLHDNIIGTLTRMEKSELHHYVGIHAAKIRTVSKTPVHKLMNVKIDSPSGVTVGMLEAAKAVADITEAVDINGVLDGIEKEMDKIHRAVSRKEIDSANALLKNLAVGLGTGFVDGTATGVKKLTGEKVKKTDEMEKAMGDSIALEYKNAASRSDQIETALNQEDSSSTQPFSELYGSVKDYRETMDVLMELESNIKTAKRAVPRLEDINESVGGIADIVEEGEIDKAFVVRLGTVVRALAIRFHQFGFAVGSQMKLEHSFAIQTNQLFKSL